MTEQEYTAAERAEVEWEESLIRMLYQHDIICSEVVRIKRTDMGLFVTYQRYTLYEQQDEKFDVRTLFPKKPKL